MYMQKNVSYSRTFLFAFLETRKIKLVCLSHIPLLPQFFHRALIVLSSTLGRYFSRVILL